MNNSVYWVVSAEEDDGYSHRRFFCDEYSAEQCADIWEDYGLKPIVEVIDFSKLDIPF
jgi:hypothetical protein